MKIDFSAVAIVLLFVAPGYFAYRTRNHFAPRSLSPKGPTEEFAGFVVISAFAHCLLGAATLVLAVLAGLASHLNPLRFFVWADSIDFQVWLHLHKSAGFVIVISYFLLSCACGSVLGLPLALSDLSWKGGLFRWVQAGKRGAWLRRQGVRGIIVEQPAIYTALRPDLDEHGREKYVFVEAELRESKGFYAGQVSNYSVSRDEDPHKLVLLRNTSYSPDDSSAYEPVIPSGTVLIDLADVLVLRVQQVPRGPIPVPNRRS